MNKEKRDQLVRQLMDKIERDVPKETLIRWILNETAFSLSAARNLIKEAEFRVNEPKSGYKGPRLA